MKYKLRQLGLIVGGLVIFFAVVGGLLLCIEALNRARPVDKFIPGLHEIRTGDTGESVTDWAGWEEARVLVVAYLSPGCRYCEEIAPVLNAVAETINKSEFSSEVAFVVVVPGERTDKAVKEFADRHGFTIPVLAGMTAQEMEDLKIVNPETGTKMFPTPMFIGWVKYEGRWIQLENVNQRTGNVEGEDLLEWVAYLMVLDEFNEGWHTVRTWMAAENGLAFVPKGKQVVFVIHFDTRNEKCDLQITEALDARNDFITWQYNHKVAIILADVAQESDAAILDYVTRLGVPLDIPVVAGAPEEYNKGTPQVFVILGFNKEWIAVDAWPYIVEEDSSLVTADAFFGSAEYWVDVLRAEGYWE